MRPVRLSARPSATVWRPQPQTASAIRGVPPQYFTVISASKARRWGPVIVEAARRRSAICDGLDRKSTRLNSSHVSISYAVFCLKKKKKKQNKTVEHITTDRNQYRIDVFSLSWSYCELSRH